MIPIRCYSCGKPIAHLWEEFTSRVDKGENRKDVMNDIGLEYIADKVFLSPS